MKRLLVILYQPYKWLFFLPFLVINTLFFGVVAVLFSFLFNQRIGSLYGGALWSKLNGLLTPMFVSVEGKHNINPGTSYVVVSNHQSAYDIFLIYGWIGIDIRWIMKKELKKVPGIGFGSEMVGHIFLDRSNPIKAMESINEAKKKLVNGTSVVIFPEGTRTKNGELGVFKKGAFKIASDLGLPILPVTIVGTEKILPNNSTNLLPGRVKLVIHQPIGVDQYNGMDVEKLINEVREKIQSSH